MYVQWNLASIHWTPAAVREPICEFEWLEGIKLKPEQSDHDLAIFKA